MIDTNRENYVQEKFGFDSWIWNTEYKILYDTLSVDKLI